MFLQLPQLLCGTRTTLVLVNHRQGRSHWLATPTCSRCCASLTTNSLFAAVASRVQCRVEQLTSVAIGCRWHQPATRLAWHVVVLRTRWRVVLDQSLSTSAAAHQAAGYATVYTCMAALVLDHQQHRAVGLAHDVACWFSMHCW